MTIPSTKADTELQYIRAREIARLRGLYVVTDAGAPGGHLAMAEAALCGGAKIIQLRDKAASSRELLQLAQQLRALTNRHDALLIVNDRTDIALACDADGVHLGDDDLPLENARRILGAKLLGASCANVEEMRRAQREGADYIGVGAIFGSQTKLDAGAPIGTQKLREIVCAATLPIAAIGGITLENIAAVAECGAPMICVVSAISRANSAQEMTEKTREIVSAARFDTRVSTHAFRPD